MWLCGFLSSHRTVTHEPEETAPSILSNTASESGGGVFVIRPSALVARCRFDGNSAGQSGGGLSFPGGQVESSTFFANTASTFGGALAMIQFNSNHPIPFVETSVRSCVMAGNSAADGGLLKYSGVNRFR